MWYLFVVFQFLVLTLRYFTQYKNALKFLLTPYTANIMFCNTQKVTFEFKLIDLFPFYSGGNDAFVVKVFSNLVVFLI